MTFHSEVEFNAWYRQKKDEYIRQFCKPRSNEYMTNLCESANRFNAFVRETLSKNNWKLIEHVPIPDVSRKENVKVVSLYKEIFKAYKPDRKPKFHIVPIDTTGMELYWPKNVLHLKTQP